MDNKENHENISMEVIWIEENNQSKQKDTTPIWIKKNDRDEGGEVAKGWRRRKKMRRRKKRKEFGGGEIVE